MVYSPINAIINGNFNIKSKINIVLGGHSRGMISAIIFVVNYDK